MSAVTAACIYTHALTYVMTSKARGPGERTDNDLPDLEYEEDAICILPDTFSEKSGSA